MTVYLNGADKLFLEECYRKVQKSLASMCPWRGERHSGAGERNVRLERRMPNMQSHVPTSEYGTVLRL